MALRLLLSNRLIIPQRISLTRFCRCYTPLSFEHRSTNSSSSISNSSLYCQQFQTKTSPLLSTHQIYLPSYKFASSSSSSSPPSSSDNKPPSSSSDDSSSSSSNDGKSSSNNNNDDEDGGNENPDSKVSIVLQPGNPLMPVEVPENYPIVPLIPVSRHPLFPKFIKMLEITNKDLVELIRRKVKLNQPYAGIFLRKENEKPPIPEVKTSTTDSKTSETTKEKEKMATTITSDVIKNLDEVYKIGSFVQIHEVHDMGDRLRMIVMAHRRIRIVGLASDDLGIEEIDRRRPPQKSNGSRRRQRRKGRLDVMINYAIIDFYR
jgi:hypothetical protein